MRRYVQQYGKERTGTNYLKALLAANFTDIVLFDNRLGSKHQPYCGVREWMEGRGIRSRADFEELLETDKYWKSRNIPSDSQFEWVHQPLTYEELLALRDGAPPLGYLINIKDPYAYAVSMHRWKRDGLKNFCTPPRSLVDDAESIRRHCLEFNAAYASYWQLIENGRGSLVRYEDLLSDPTCILRRIRDKFHLTQSQAELRDVDTTVAPTFGVSTSPFYRSFYLRREYMAALNAECAAVVWETIDWELMGRYGYSAGHAASAGAF